MLEAVNVPVTSDTVFIASQSAGDSAAKSRFVDCFLSRSWHQLLQIVFSQKANAEKEIFMQKIY